MYTLLKINLLKHIPGLCQHALTIVFDQPFWVSSVSFTVKAMTKRISCRMLMSAFEVSITGVLLLRVQNLQVNELWLSEECDSHCMGYRYVQ